MSNPTDSRLEDATERERMRRVFQSGLNAPAGYVLPLQREQGQDGPEWQTGLWMLRGRHLFLIARRFSGRIAPSADESAVDGRSPAELHG